MAEGPEFDTPDGLFYSPLGEISPARADGRRHRAAVPAAVSDLGAKHPVTRGLPGPTRTRPPGVGPLVPRSSPLMRQAAKR